MFARSLISFLANHGKASGGNGLAVTFVLLVGRDHFDLFGEFGKELIQYMPRLLDDDRAALATGDTTKQEHLADLVKVSVMGDGVTKVGADGGIDFGGTLVARAMSFCTSTSCSGKGISAGSSMPAAGTRRATAC